MTINLVFAAKVPDVKKVYTYKEYIVRSYLNGKVLRCYQNGKFYERPANGFHSWRLHRFRGKVIFLLVDKNVVIDDLENCEVIDYGIGYINGN